MSIMWEIYLNRYFCKADEYTGNRPCDSGMYCTACHGENVQADYEAFKRNFSLVETAIKDAKEVLTDEGTEEVKVIAISKVDDTTAILVVERQCDLYPLAGYFDTVGKLYTAYQRWYYDVLGQTFVKGKEFNTMEEAYGDFWERLREEHKVGV